MDSRRSRLTCRALAIAGNRRKPLPCISRRKHSFVTHPFHDRNALRAFAECDRELSSVGGNERQSSKKQPYLIFHRGRAGATQHYDLSLPQQIPRHRYARRPPTRCAAVGAIDEGNNLHSLNEVSDHPKGC